MQDTKNLEPRLANLKRRKRLHSLVRSMQNETPSISVQKPQETISDSLKEAELSANVSEQSPSIPSLPCEEDSKTYTTIHSPILPDEATSGEESLKQISEEIEKSTLQKKETFTNKDEQKERESSPALPAEPKLISPILFSFLFWNKQIRKKRRKKTPFISYSVFSCLLSLSLYALFVIALYDPNTCPIWEKTLADAENIEKVQEKHWDNQEKRRLERELQKSQIVAMEETEPENTEEVLNVEEPIQDASIPLEPIQSENVYAQESEGESSTNISYEPMNIWHVSYIPWFYAESAPADGSIGMWLPGYFVAHNNTPNGNMIASQPQFVEVDGQIYHLVSAIIDNDDLGDWQFLYARANNGIVFQTCITDDTNWFLHYEPVQGYPGYPYQWTIYPYCVGDGPFDLSGA